jgi:hypothetical protein
MTAAGELPNKKDVARALLLKGTLFVHLDPRNENTRVPAWFKRQPQLVLQVGLDMPVPIPDLRVDDVGVFGTLSFNRTSFTCAVPWDAVFALVGDDGRGMVWPASVPKEIAAEIEREARTPRAQPSERGPVKDLSPQAKRPRRVAPPAPPADRSGELAEKRMRAAPKGLELIASKDARRGTAVSRERRVPPPYLRLVK